MRTGIEFVSELSEAEARQLLFDIFERVPLEDGAEHTYASLPDKITRAVNEARRLTKLEGSVTKYIVEECNNGNIGVQDPINYLIASHRMLRYNLHDTWKEEY
jgi:hypothetical protein